MRIGLVHPGSMGVTVGLAAARNAEVWWASHGRSDASKTRATDAGFADAGTLAELARMSEVIISLVPPAAAESCADQVAEAGFAGIYVDANAIAPVKSLRIAEAVAPATFVDGGVVGPPALEAGTTRLYLSGPESSIIGELFAGSILEVIELGPEIGAASALKMAYAVYTKGSSALVMAVRALAQSHGLTEPLLAEWTRSIPDLPERSSATLRHIPKKAWRFVGEMEEIAATFRAAGLPGEFHDAAAEVFGRVGPEAEERDPDEVVRLIQGDGEA